MDLFADSIVAAALGKPIPEDGYPGGYIDDLAERSRRPARILDLPAGERRVAFRGRATPPSSGPADPARHFNTHFDVWFSERELPADDSPAPSPTP